MGQSILIIYVLFYLTIIDPFEHTNYLFKEHKLCHERCTTYKGFRANFGLNENGLVECNEMDKGITKMKHVDILMGDISKVGWAVVLDASISNNDMDSLMQLNKFKQKTARS